MPYGVIYTDAIVYENKVYLIGGRSNDEYWGTDKILSASIDDNGNVLDWNINALLPAPLFGTRCVSTQNRILLFGGYTEVPEYGNLYSHTVFEAILNESKNIVSWNIYTNVIPNTTCYTQLLVTKNFLYMISGENYTSSVLYTDFSGWVWPNANSSYYEDNGII